MVRPTSVEAAEILVEGSVLGTCLGLSLGAVGVQSEDALRLRGPVAPRARRMTALLGVRVIVLSLICAMALSILVSRHEAGAAWQGLDVDISVTDGFVGRAVVEGTGDGQLEVVIVGPVVREDKLKVMVALGDAVHAALGDVMILVDIIDARDRAGEGAVPEEQPL